MKTLRVLQRKNILKASDDFSDVYENHKLMKYFFPKDCSRFEKVKSLFRYRLKTSLNCCFQLSEEGRGVILLQNRSVKSISFSIMDLIYGLRFVSEIGFVDLFRLIRFQMFSDRLLSKLGGEKCWYIDLFMVPQDLQGQGVGTKALIEVFQSVNSSGLPIYLETMDEKNVKFYQKFGFQIVASPKIPGSNIIYYCMIRPPYQFELKPESCIDLKTSSQKETTHVDSFDVNKDESIA